MLATGESYDTLVASAESVAAADGSLFFYPYVDGAGRAPATRRG